MFVQCSKHKEFYSYTVWFFDYFVHPLYVWPKRVQLVQLVIQTYLKNEYVPSWTSNKTSHLISSGNTNTKSSLNIKTIN
jgi:hypothetical protein